MYSKKIMQLFLEAKNAGGFQGANGVGKYENEKTGEVYKLYIKINENNIVEECQFKTKGNPVAIALSSVLCDILVDKTLEEIKDLSISQISEQIGEIPEEKTYCLQDMINMLNSTLLDYNKRILKAQKHSKSEEE